ncbi:MAG: hypothetical protein Q9222_003464 [Ikaeria aurantiellina]
MRVVGKRFLDYDTSVDISSGIEEGYDKESYRWLLDIQDMPLPPPVGDSSALEVPESPEVLASDETATMDGDDASTIPFPESPEIPSSRRRMEEEEEDS